jgi:hypothetical protein
MDHYCYGVTQTTNASDTVPFVARRLFTAAAAEADTSVPVIALGSVSSAADAVIPSQRDSAAKVLHEFGPLAVVPTEVVCVA